MMELLKLLRVNQRRAGQYLLITPALFILNLFILNKKMYFPCLQYHRRHTTVLMRRNINYHPSRKMTTELLSKSIIKTNNICFAETGNLSIDWTNETCINSIMSYEITFTCNIFIYEIRGANNFFWIVKINIQATIWKFCYCGVKIFITMNFTPGILICELDCQITGRINLKNVFS